MATKYLRVLTEEILISLLIIHSSHIHYRSKDFCRNNPCAEKDLTEKKKKSKSRWLKKITIMLLIRNLKHREINWLFLKPFRKEQDGSSLFSPRSQWGSSKSYCKILKSKISQSKQVLKSGMKLKIWLRCQKG